MLMSDAFGNPVIIDKIIEELKNTLANTALEIIGSDIMREMIATVCLEVGNQANKPLAESLQKTVDITKELVKELAVLQHKVGVLEIKMEK